MNFKHKAALAATTAALLGVAGTAQAAFQGRDATGAASASCTSTGPDKCTYFYDTTLGITILNKWNLGAGTWSASAASGSAQALAASAGLSASGLTGWLLPTGDEGAAPGAQNQYLSIWNSVGGSFAGLSGQFDGAQAGYYWSGTVYALYPGLALAFNSSGGFLVDVGQNELLFAVAVRSGDVAAVPEPINVVLMLAGLAAIVSVVRRSRTATA